MYVERLRVMAIVRKWLIFLFFLILISVRLLQAVLDAKNETKLHLFIDRLVSFLLFNPILDAGKIVCYLTSKM